MPNSQQMLHNQTQQIGLRDSLFAGSTVSYLNETPQNIMSVSMMAGFNPSLTEAQYHSSLEYKIKQLPQLPEIPFDNVRQQDNSILIKYIQVDINDKNQPDSKVLRHQLGIGMPEATGIVNVTQNKTLQELIFWYFRDIDKNSTDPEIIELLSFKSKVLQFSIGSPARTARFLALILSISFSEEGLKKELISVFKSNVKFIQRLQQLVINNF